MRVCRAVAAAAVLVTVACRPAGGGGQSIGDILFVHPAAWNAGDPGNLTVGFRVINHGATPDTLYVESPVAGGAAQLHDNGPGGMHPLDFLALPPGSSSQLGLGRHHVMITGLADTVAKGDILRLRVRLARSGRLVLSVPVLRFTEARRELGS